MRPGDLARAAFLKSNAITRRKVDRSQLPALVAAGKTDPQIAALFGSTLQAVRVARIDLGLPRNEGRHQTPGSYRGIIRMHKSAREDAAKLASSYGLPTDLHPRQVAVMILLANGPSTKPELYSLLGGKDFRLWSWRSNHLPSGCYLADLCERGLTTFIRRFRKGRGEHPRLYMLTPAAMDMLSSGRNSDDQRRTDSVRGAASVAPCQQTAESP